jgi:hypothetical protein
MTPAPLMILWTNNIVKYDLGLANFDIDVEELRRPMEQTRTFRGWVEELAKKTRDYT